MTFAARHDKSFPAARPYRLLAAASPCFATHDSNAGLPAVREYDDLRDEYFHERHLKCIWFDNALRPPQLKTENGEEVLVEFPGCWNLEAGPDFRGAVLRHGASQKIIKGDVEIHVHPTDWHKHAHAKNPDYARVVAHVTWFPGPLATDTLPRDALQISLRNAMAGNPFFAFESIDLTAYPHASRPANTPCARLLCHWPSGQIAALLESAGNERLRRKTIRMAGAMKMHGSDQAFYAELMAALGYKHNQKPFRRLAELCPLAILREETAGDTVAAYALLMGIAGLLPAQNLANWDAETRKFIRLLWQHWWKLQERWGEQRLSRDAWTLGGIRPQNHPRRRLMAAAFLFTQPKTPLEYLASLAYLPPEQWLAKILAWLQPGGGTYWQHRLALGGTRQNISLALTGQRRAAAMINNVIIPCLAALSEESADQCFFPSAVLQSLPSEEDNNLIRRTAADLLGSDHNPRLYKNGLRQQGLLQVFHDFCLNDRSDCAQCQLLRALESFHTLKPQTRP